MVAPSNLRFSPLPLMMAIVACVFSVDLYIPSMPEMLKAFGTTQEMMQFSISAGLIGTSMATIIIGPLSDALGRRSVLLYSQSLYFLGCLATLFVTDINSFIICRFVQGLGGAAAFAIGFAMVADLFEGTRAARYFSYLTTTITLSLVVAPLFGGFFAAYYPWQAAFAFLAFLAGLSILVLYWRLPETLTQPGPLSIKKSLSAYGTLLMHKRFIVLATVPSLLIGGIVVFMATGAFYFIRQLDISPSLYGIFQGVVMLSNTLASYLSARLIERFGLNRSTVFGVSMFSAGSLGFLALTLISPEQTAAIIFAVSLYAAGLGLTFNTLTAQSMALFKHSAGTVSSAISFLRGLIIAACVSAGSQIYDGSLWPTALFIAGISVVCVGAYVHIQRTKSLTNQASV